MSYPIALQVVSGTTRPLNPNNITLWLNSHFDVSKWNFGQEFPLWPIEGEVFIKHRYVSDNHVSLGKDINVIGNIGAVYQLQRHLWVRCDCEYFYNGNWYPTNFKLYNSGIFHSNWPWTLHNHRLVQTPGAGGATTNILSATLTEYTNYLTIVSQTANGYTTSHSEFHPTSLMNVSGIDNIIFDYEYTGSSSNKTKLYFSISAATDSYANCYTNAASAYRWTASAAGSRQIYELSTSNLVGNYYINVGHYLAQDEAGGVTFTIYNIELA